MTGPFETEAEARAVPAVRAAYDAARDRRGAMDAANLGMLLDAAEVAGITLGAYDRRIVGWLAGWEPQSCAVVAGLVTRAYMAGRAEGMRGGS
jgi:hypothetical protein